MSSQKPVTEGPREQQGTTQSSRVLWILLGALVVVALAGWALAWQRSRPLTQAATPPPLEGPAVTSMPQAAPPLAPPVTEMPQKEGATPEEKPKAPPEVLRYLEHLKRVEAYRQSMRDDVGPALDMLKDAYGLQLGLDDEDDPLSQKKLQSGYSRYTQQWQNLIRYFQALQPPQQCAKLGTTYGQALNSYVYIWNQIQLAMANQDISRLLRLRRSGQAGVDAQLKASNAELESVCKQFDIRKEFDITADDDVGSLLGL